MTEINRRKINQRDQLHKPKECRRQNSNEEEASEMVLVEPKSQDEGSHPGQRIWSHRRSATFVLAGGVLFWTIVLLFLFGFRFL